MALRWHARFCAETHGVGLEGGRLVLDLLAAVGGAEPERAGRALRELLASYDQALAEPLRGLGGSAALMPAGKRQVL